MLCPYSQSYDDLPKMGLIHDLPFMSLELCLLQGEGKGRDVKLDHFSDLNFSISIVCIVYALHCSAVGLINYYDEV